MFDPFDTIPAAKVNAREVENPPAFPSQLHEARDPGDHDPQYGMTLRDWFAGQALSSVPPHVSIGSGDADWSAHRHHQAAAWAYARADAMLAARAQVAK